MLLAMLMMIIIILLIMENTRSPGHIGAPTTIIMIIINSMIIMIIILLIIESKYQVAYEPPPRQDIFKGKLSTEKPATEMFESSSKMQFLYCLPVEENHHPLYFWIVCLKPKETGNDHCSKLMKANDDDNCKVNLLLGIK